MQRNHDVSTELRGNYFTVKRITYENGILLWLEDHKFPFKGMATEETVDAANKIKSLLKTPFFFLRLQKATKILPSFFPQPNHLTPVAREILSIIPIRLGTLMAFVLEYDAAYRLRLQDLLSETSKEEMVKQPIREILRLLKINKRRDYEIVHRKIRNFAYIFILALLFPPFREKFKKSLQRSNFQNLQLDDGDRYWLKQRTDYKYGA